MKVLVINVGSSSIKYQLYQMPEAIALAKGIVERIGEDWSGLSHFYGGKTCSIQAKVEDHKRAMELILQTLVSGDLPVVENVGEIEAVGHRVVHGGEEFTGSVFVDDNVLASIEKFAELAPLHNPHNLTGIRAAQQSLPTAKQVACFDTAFHSTLPQIAFLYALPYEVYRKYRVRKYGFHGISHRYVARRAAVLLGKHKYSVNLITCHLGNGCSITAVQKGKSVDTSMGFTPLEGLVMGTRSGDFDPAVCLYLARKRYSLGSLGDMFNKKSGLLGISGVSNDMRSLVSLAGQGSLRAQLAIDIFCYRVRKYIGAYVAVLSDVDALVFTGGIGENSVKLREQICRGLCRVGIELSEYRNCSAVGRECEVSNASSKVKVFVIPTNEEVAIANDAYELARK